VLGTEGRNFELKMENIEDVLFHCGFDGIFFQTSCFGGKDVSISFHIDFLCVGMLTWKAEISNSRWTGSLEQCG